MRLIVRTILLTIPQLGDMAPNSHKWISQEGSRTLKTRDSSKELSIRAYLSFPHRSKAIQLIKYHKDYPRAST